MNDDRPAEPTAKPRSWLTRPLLFKNHPEIRVAFWLYVIGTLLAPSFLLHTVSTGISYATQLFFAPFLQLTSHLPRLESTQFGQNHAELMMYLPVVLGVLSLTFPFLTLYLIAWAYRRKRIAVFVILGLGAVAAFCTGTAIDHYAKRPDWTSHGLDPDRDGFVPASVWMSGLATHPEHNNSTSTRFDLILAGPEHAYLKLWCKPYHGRLRLLGFDDIAIQIPGHYDFGNRGVSSQSQHFRPGQVPLREISHAIWPTNSTVPRATVTSPDEAEVSVRVQAVTNIGPFTVPLRFRTETWKNAVQFEVKRIEFHGRPNPRWVRAAYARQFGLPDEENDVGDVTVSIPPEPGWSNTGKAKRP